MCESLYTHREEEKNQQGETNFYKCWLRWLLHIIFALIIRVRQEKSTKLPSQVPTQTCTYKDRIYYVKFFPAMNLMNESFLLFSAIIFNSIQVT